MTDVEASAMNVYNEGTFSVTDGKFSLYGAENRASGHVLIPIFDLRIKYHGPMLIRDKMSR